MNPNPPNTCCCGTSHAAVMRCNQHHRYFGPAGEYDSVTKIIKTCLPVKKYEGIPADVLANAADRGSRAAHYCELYATTGNAEIPAGERGDIEPYVDSFVRWWDKGPLRKHVWNQTIVSQDSMRIAGTIDLLWTGGLADLKCTWNIEADYGYQVAAYCEMTTFLNMEIGVIHIRPAKRGGTRWVEFDPAEWVPRWRRLRDFYLDVREVLNG